MYVIFLLIGILIGTSVILILKSLHKGEEVPVAVETDKIEISFQDLIRLVAVNVPTDVNSLMVEHKVNVKLPDFYGAYQTLTKHERDLYFTSLVEILGKNRRDFIHHIFDNYPGCSTQDVLLLLMKDMQFDNKTMAHILGVTPDTLKKRKNRLKLKISSVRLETTQEETL